VSEFSSIQAGQLIRKSSIRRSWKQVLRALTDYADRAGVCWPSRYTLARDIGVTGRTIQRTMAELKRAGLVVVLGWRCRGQFVSGDQPTVAAGRGWVPVYRVCVDRIELLQPPASVPEPTMQPAAVASASGPEPADDAAELPFIPDDSEEWQRRLAETLQEPLELPELPLEPLELEPLELPADDAAELPFIPDDSEEWQRLVKEMEEFPVPDLQEPPASVPEPTMQPAAAEVSRPQLVLVSEPAVKRSRSRSSQGRAGGRVRAVASEQQRPAVWQPPGVPELLSAAAEMVPAEELECGLPVGALNTRRIALRFAKWLAGEKREPVGGWRLRLNLWIAEDAARVPPADDAVKPVSKPAVPTAAEQQSVERLWQQLRGLLRTSSTYQEMREKSRRPEVGGPEGPLSVAMDLTEFKRWQDSHNRADVERVLRSRLLAEVRRGVAADQPSASVSRPEPVSIPSRPVMSVTGGH
jgi:hypothetical protein